LRNATSSPSGYVGEDVGTSSRSCCRNAITTSRRPQTGIVYIDEIDKISAQVGKPVDHPRRLGEGVQQALLKLIGGTIASVPPRRPQAPQQEFLQVDTSNILFISVRLRG